MSVANAPCLHMTTTLHARSVGWQLANLAWIWRISAIIFVGMDFQTVGETEKVLGGRQSGSQLARETALGLQPSLDSKRGFLSKPVSASGSGPTSEISSQAGEDDFEDNLLVSTPNQQFEQVLVVQAQNGVNMASGTATTAPSTAPLTLAGPSTMEPFVPIRAQLGAQDTPSVIQGAQDTPGVNQGARPAISTEQTMQSTQRYTWYSTLPYVSGLEAFNADITCCQTCFNPPLVFASQLSLALEARESLCLQL